LKAKDIGLPRFEQALLYSHNPSSISRHLGPFSLATGTILHLASGMYMSITDGKSTPVVITSYIEKFKNRSAISRITLTSIVG
jgi:hypothetical protein